MLITLEKGGSRLPQKKVVFFILFYGARVETALLNSPSYIKSYVLTYGVYMYGGK